ncbi:hypothetical protein EX895_003018 [Sporisorium graminicola]|uniref:RFX-type winged-helix domain-containing protein n=1 Tax=Sporisorium graminicola TaxID=280036 RepID=A0A4U7KYJ7_9BASI|nr:hypothetical protein EX895_003018 [Sporisorium graminicola]TKY87922.1 hypothetical protein EX895_003018 [Sporisorium graminicola]
MSSYPQHASPAGAAYGAASPSVIRSQNLPYVPPHAQSGQGLPMLPYTQHPQHHSGFPPPNQQFPNHSRPIAALPSHARHMHAPSMPSARPQISSSKPHTPSSILQHRGSSTRLPHLSGDADAPFKRLKMVGDGFEAPYLLPGPSNRILLSLKSGLPSQIDWALSRLVQLTSNHRDQAAREFTLDSVPGLADVLLSYVYRIHAALTGEHPSKWAASYFEQNLEAPDVGIGAPGDGGHQGISTYASTLVKRPPPIPVQPTAFNPSFDASHAVLMRRALEAALSLRNLAMNSSNARSLASIKGIFGLIRNILRLPATAVQMYAQPTLDHEDCESQPADGWLEVEGVAELRLYFLDIFETLASKVSLTRRAATVPPTPISTALAAASGKDTVPVKVDGPSAADDIFATLISLALKSNDRAFLLGSLRCLSTMAAIERNEVAFIEVTLPHGQHSPGLLQRCVELLPLTQDTELLDAVLDLLYQLVCIGNNAIKIAAPFDSEPRKHGTANSHTASAVATRATAKTNALVRLLLRNLQLGRTMWERLIPLKVPSAWLSSVPNRHIETMRRRRDLLMRIANETPEERAKRKKLTPQERKSLLGLKEPERGIAWMKMVFQRDATKEVTQMEFWTAYKEEFGQQSDGVPLQPAAELIRAVGQVFPAASAMVVQGKEGQPQRFVIRGISVKDRDIDTLEPFRCYWSTCPAPHTNTLESQRSHAKLHAEYASDGHCRWRRCNYDVKSSSTSSTEAEQKRTLVAHVLTHIKSDESGSGPFKPSKRADIVVDEDLRVVSGATHTGEAARLVTTKASHGGRVLRGKRDSDGVETAFTLGKTAPANGTANGHVATSNAAPSTGTVDNPGSYVLDVTRTPTAGNDDNLSPQGPAFTSILILRMLTRRAASLLQKAGSKRSNETEDAEDAAAVRGQGDEKFGLPLPANFGSSDRGRRVETGDANTANGNGNSHGNEVDGDSMLDGEDEDYETTAVWAVEAATRLLDAVEGVEEDLMHHSSQNDILSSYINETLLELRRRPTVGAPGSSLLGQVDPRILNVES